MDELAQLKSTAISAVIGPTFKTYARLLLANKASILSIPSTTLPYGSHPRQTLDIYSSPAPKANSPILIFLYGGGLTRGDKIIPPIPERLAYHNLGAFFAENGYTTIIPDYRRVDDAKEGTGEGAVFPSGGDDIALVLEWLGSTYLKDNEQGRDVFLMGNSAGGVHLSTFLMWSKFLEQRRKLLQSTKLRVAGAVLLSVPLDFQGATAVRQRMLDTYWPSSLSKDPSNSIPSYVQFDPAGLLQILASEDGAKGKKPADFGIPPVLAAVGEFDPEDEIVDSMKRFRTAWGDIFGESDEIELLEIEGHNHISPPLSLKAGEAREDKWGNDVVAWMDRISKRA
jgi:acetyl esterase/lipase